MIIYEDKDPAWVKPFTPAGELAAGALAAILLFLPVLVYLLTP